MGIVAEIERLTENASFFNRSIGVVSLVGSHQARYIQELLLQRVGEDIFRKHTILCGDSATFQGDERDIVFLSLVECANTSISKTALQFQQRFNVAVSRARDRAYLYRSVALEQLNPNDLKAKLIRHFDEPTLVQGIPGNDLSSLCESAFEREVYGRLRDIGYRVTPQVSVGPFSIDLVVEGDNDSRLAIELDGDRYHGPDTWADDLSRQRILERVGWTFWRCWGSSFRLDPDGCMDDLISVLDDLHISPKRSVTKTPIGYTAHFILTDRWELIGPNDDQGIPGESVDGGAAISNVAALDAANLTYGRVEDDPVQAQTGDTLFVTFADEPNRMLSWVLVPDAHQPDAGRINVSHVLGKKLLGAMVDDEIEIELGRGPRTVVIHRIERPIVEDVRELVSKVASDVIGVGDRQLQVAPIAAMVVHDQQSREPSQFKSALEQRLLDTSKYRAVDPVEVVPQPDPARFFDLLYAPQIQRMIEHVIASEGPVLDDVLVRRIARAHGFQRSGSRIRDHVLRFVPRDIPTTEERDLTFYWPRGATPSEVTSFRRPFGEEIGR